MGRTLLHMQCKVLQGATGAAPPAVRISATELYNVHLDMELRSR
jgi:hypothetical protein